MRHTKAIIILTMLFGLFGCKDSKDKDFVFEEFKTQIEKKGMKIDSVDESGLVHISRGDWKLKVSLENTRKNFSRDKDKVHITTLVESILVEQIEIPENWVECKDKVFISLFPNDIDFDDMIHKKITDEFSKVYMLSSDSNQIFLSKDYLEKWNITENDLDIQANYNADNLLSKSTLSFDTIDNRKLGIINVDNETLKPALLFAPTMREKVKKDFSFPFYAVIPVRDFCYIFSEKDFDFFSGRLGDVVADEYNQSAYPITTEVIRFSDKGVESVGQYPKK